MSQYSEGPEQSSTAGSYDSGGGNVPPTRPRRPRRSGIIAVLIAILLIILALLFFFPRPAAAVMLTPASKTLSNPYTIPVVARGLSSAQQGSQTGVPTGPLKPGTHAGGWLTFKNYTLHWVTILAGTAVTDVTGQQVKTDYTIQVPPEPPIIPGVASVHATAVKVGKSGNIQAMSISKPCCFAGIYVLNASAFSGGLDAQTAHSVLQSDINSAAKALETSLVQKAQSAIQSQLESGEQLVNGSPSCSSPKVTSNPGVGESAAKFTVTVSLACSDSAYNPQTALSQAEDMLKQTAAQQLGPSFNLVGNIATRVEQATPGENGNVNVVVTASGTWKYHFTAAQKLDMAKLIAGKTISEAKARLLQQRGVADASILVSGPIFNLVGNRITDDLERITING